MTVLLGFEERTDNYKSKKSKSIIGLIELSKERNIEFCFKSYRWPRPEYELKFIHIMGFEFIHYLFYQENRIRRIWSYLFDKIGDNFGSRIYNLHLDA